MLAAEANIPDPLGLPVAEFDGLLAALSEGAPRRAEPMDARQYVERMMREGGAR